MSDPSATLMNLLKIPKPIGSHVIIIGGGASGVLLAVHLLSNPDWAMAVTIVEPRAQLGHGVAYSTEDDDHLLNTRVHNMSAFPNDPHHFSRWLTAWSEGAQTSDQAFVSRKVYGAYLSDLLRPWLKSAQPARLRFARATATSIKEDQRGVRVLLDDGSTVVGDRAVLATGHVLPESKQDSPMLGAWDAIGNVDPAGRIVIVGSGLSMVDQVLSILKSGHTGPIVAISRRGQLPRSHAPTVPLKLGIADVPLGAPISILFDWARSLARKAEAQGGTWRDAVDGIRPHVRAMWRALPLAERARFLRHCATWWDVHRHRIPPASNATIRAAIASGQLSLQRGTYHGVIENPVSVRFTPFGKAVEHTISAVRVIDCRGIRRDPEQNASPLVKDLLARGKARIDPLRIGLEVDNSSQIVDQAGQASERILAVGPASRAAFWEITAIPDIREQCASLSDALVKRSCSEATVGSRSATK